MHTVEPTITVTVISILVRRLVTSFFDTFFIARQHIAYA